MRVAAAKVTSMDAVVAAVLSKLDGIFILKEEQRMTPKAFLSIKDVFTLLLTGSVRCRGPLGIKIPTDGTSALKQTTGL